MQIASKLTERILAANKAGRKALIPYIPAGFPDKETFWKEVKALDDNGADIIEVGVPFSDPVADGPVVEQAALDCLAQGVCLEWLLGDLAARRSSINAEIVLMGYMNPFMQYGWERLAEDAAQAGVAGLIVPDLPLEEGVEIKAALAAHGIDLVSLIGLNTPPERLRAYAEHATGFVYFVSVLGTTGERRSLPEEIRLRLEEARSTFDIPLALGFGIASPEQLEPFAEHIDAVVFGSALIRHLRGGQDAASFMARWRS